MFFLRGSAVAQNLHVKIEASAVACQRQLNAKPNPKVDRTLSVLQDSQRHSERVSVCVRLVCVCLKKISSFHTKALLYAVNDRRSSKFDFPIPSPLSLLLLLFRWNANVALEVSGLASEWFQRQTD